METLKLNLFHFLIAPSNCKNSKSYVGYFFDMLSNQMSNLESKRQKITFPRPLCFRIDIDKTEEDSKMKRIKKTQILPNCVVIMGIISIIFLGIVTFFSVTEFLPTIKVLPPSVLLDNIKFSYAVG